MSSIEKKAAAFYSYEEIQNAEDELELEYEMSSMNNSGQQNTENEEVGEEEEEEYSVFDAGEGISDYEN